MPRVLAGLAAQSVRRSAWPAYPTRLEVQSRPELLARHQPAAFLSKPELAAAAAGMLLAANVASCNQSGSQPLPQRRAANAPAIVAPIFKHGEGLGQTGGTRTARGFLSEEEAFCVIRDELRQPGIELHARDVPVGKLAVRVGANKDFYDWVAQKPIWRREVTQAPLLVDGFDSQNQIAVEFVSKEDYSAWEGPWRMRWAGTAYCVETLAVARSLVEQMAGQPAGVWVGVFYDPLMTSETELN